MNKQQMVKIINELFGNSADKRFLLPGGEYRHNGEFAVTVARNDQGILVTVEAIGDTRLNFITLGEMKLALLRQEGGRFEKKERTPKAGIRIQFAGDYPDGTYFLMAV